MHAVSLFNSCKQCEILASVVTASPEFRLLIFSLMFKVVQDFKSLISFCWPVSCWKSCYTASVDTGGQANWFLSQQHWCVAFLFLLPKLLMFIFVLKRDRSVLLVNQVCVFWLERMFSFLIPDSTDGMYNTHRAVRDNMDPIMPCDSELLKNLCGTFPFCFASHKRLLVHNQV